MKNVAVIEANRSHNIYDKDSVLFNIFMKMLPKVI